MFRPKPTNLELWDILMTIADQIATITADLVALKAAVAAIPTTAVPAAPVDLTPVTTAVAAVQTTANAINANLQLTPAGA